LLWGGSFQTIEVVWREDVYSNIAQTCKFSCVLYWVWNEIVDCNFWLVLVLEDEIPLLNVIGFERENLNHLDRNYLLHLTYRMLYQFILWVILWRGFIKRNSMFFLHHWVKFEWRNMRSQNSLILPVSFGGLIGSIFDLIFKNIYKYTVLRVCYPIQLLYWNPCHLLKKYPW
jgi:hypothetical protein